MQTIIEVYPDMECDYINNCLKGVELGWAVILVVRHTQRGTTFYKARVGVEKNCVLTEGV